VLRTLLYQTLHMKMGSQLFPHSPKFTLTRHVHGQFRAQLATSTSGPETMKLIPALVWIWTLDSWLTLC